MKTDVIIIGAGPAGLSTAYFLQRMGIDFLILEKGNRPGFSYSKMYDSLKLLTPAVYSQLPGRSLSRDIFRYYSRQELVDYYAHYAQHYDFPLILDTAVKAVSFEDGSYQLQTSRGEFVSRALVVATGQFSHPFRPPLKGKASIPVLHSSEYSNPDSLKIGKGKDKGKGKGTVVSDSGVSGRVLVVGGGNTGVEIAQELCEAGYAVSLSSKRPLRVLPHRFLGLDLHFWARPLELLTRLLCQVTKKPFSVKRTPVLGRQILKLIRSGHVQKCPQLLAIEGNQAVFESQRHAFDAIILATGYQFKTPFLSDSLQLSGLFKVGEPGQFGVDSGFLRGITRDAERVAQNVSTFLQA